MDKKILNKKCFFTILLIPVAIVFVIVFKYGVNVIYWDEWKTINLYNDIVSNGISFRFLGKLFEQHNEHRMFFPQIIMILTYFFTDCSSKYEMYVSVCILSISYYFIIKCIVGKKNIAELTKKEVLFSVLLGICFMSSCQWENLLWGFQIAWFLIEMSVIGSLVFFVRYLEHDEFKYWGVSVIFATIASYSSLQGIAIWPMYLCIFGMALISRRICMKQKQWISYLAVGILEIIIYFYDYSNVAFHEGYKAKGIGQCLGFMMKQIGYIFCDTNQDVAKYLGLLIVVLAVLLIFHLIYNRNLEEYLVPIGMITFSIGVLLMISIGRSNLSLSSRYTTYSLMLLAGELIILYKEVDRIGAKTAVCREWQQMLVLVEGMLLALCIVESIDCFRLCNAVYEDRIATKEALQNYKDVPLSMLKKAYPWESYEQAYDSIELLEKRNWNAMQEKQFLYDYVDKDKFRNNQEVLRSYNIDYVVIDDTSRFLTLEGWAADDYSEEEYGNVYLSINGNIYNSKGHQKREDVAEYLKNDVYKYTGFSFSKSIDILEEGINKLSIWVSTSDEKIVYASPDQYIYYDKEIGIYQCDEFGNAIVN